MELRLLENRSPSGWAEFGGYWPRGSCSGEDFALTGSDGSAVPAQNAVVAWWPDGSVKWSRHIARAEQMGSRASLVPGSPKEPASGLQITETETAWRIAGSCLSLTVPKAENILLRDLILEGVAMVRAARPVLSLAHVEETESEERRRTVSLPARVQSQLLEERGPLQAVFRFDGVHTEEGAEKMPFRIRMAVRADGEISFDHTFFFQGDPETDRLAGLGLSFEVPAAGTGYQRHIRYLTDQAVFHDHPVQLFHRILRLSPELLGRQQRGETVPASPELNDAAAGLPAWDRFVLTQDSASHYRIEKQTTSRLCWVEGVRGLRAPGAMALSDPEKCVSFCVRDFWEKYPSGLEADRLTGDTALCTVWFHSPQARPFDFRHYDTRMYVNGCYEGFDYSDPDPTGIAVTGSCSLHPHRGCLSDDGLRAESHASRKPPVYTGSPEYYHRYHAFGDWGLPIPDHPMAAWIEDQIQKAVDFYLRERETRGWYGLFDYGDFMHTYEASRHQWRYDVGGYAWDNTELAPTYWLWLQFLRTGREDVFSLAEALSRHAADVDMYHFGRLKGLGSRHNVRHWGCSCKEPRVSMAGHHRPLYYLTGSRRIGDCMKDALAADYALQNTKYYSRGGDYITLRSGPDWSSLVSNWMTAWERTGDSRWKARILRGLNGIAAAPLRLASGPDFRFQPETGDMIYLGEAREKCSMHLQACMAEPEVWAEAADLLDSRLLRDMLAENGKYFRLSPEERSRLSGNLLENRSFGGIIYSAEEQAWSARQEGDQAAAREIWRGLLGLLYREDRPEGFVPVPYGTAADGSPLMEIPWISTNFTAQWCLKAILCLAWIPESLPRDLGELSRWLREKPAEDRLYGA